VGQKHVHAADALAAAADAALVANHLPILDENLVSALARLRARNIARRNGLEAGRAR